MSITYQLLLFSILLNYSVYSASFQSHSGVCDQWVTPFWEVLVLNENRPALFADLERYFVLIDMDDSGKVNENEFTFSWKKSTLMGTEDSTYLFRDWSVLEDQTDPDNIIHPNIAGVWRQIDQDKSGEVSLDEFKLWWVKELQQMPAKGCPES